MSQTILVLGAGMVGTCTALHLQQRGFDVTLIDRREPGQETSFGNAGLIQREAVEPYAFPRDPAFVLRTALGLGAEVHWHSSGLLAMGRALLGYFRHSHPARHAVATAAYSRLIAHAMHEHTPLVAAAGAQDLVQEGGFRFVFRTPQALDEALARAQHLGAAFGVQHQAEDGAALALAEPALRQRLAGAVHWTQPWAVNDPGELVRRYATLFVQRGGHIAQADALSLQPAGAGWQVGAGGDAHRAELAVVALGPWSDGLLKRLGYRYPLFVKRGYHQHYQTQPSLRQPVLDAERGYVLAPMRRGLRLTTGAEFARVDAPATPVQLAKADALARELIDLGQALPEAPWLGARPCVADMLPLIGPAPRHRGLWLHLGHAHQGFTLGPASARLLAELMAGDTPYIDPTPYSPARWG
jgi:D-amino-acid dehydrogenase